VEGERASEQIGQRREVDRAVADERRGRRDGDAGVVLAEPLRLQLPAERVANGDRREQDAVGGDGRIDRRRARLVEERERHYFFSMPRSSTSNTSVEPGLMSGGDPRSPYAMSDGQVSFALPPTFISCTPSVQHLMT